MEGLVRYYLHEKDIKDNSQQKAKIFVVKILYIDNSHKDCNFKTITSDDYYIY